MPKFAVWITDCRMHLVTCGDQGSRKIRSELWTGTESKGTGNNSRVEPRRNGGRLTEDDLDVINGRQDQLEGKLQERYGIAKDQAKKDVDAWFKSLP